jgi:hypothetical protein
VERKPEDLPWLPFSTQGDLSNEWIELGGIIYAGWGTDTSRKQTSLRRYPHHCALVSLGSNMPLHSVAHCLLRWWGHCESNAVLVLHHPGAKFHCLPPACCR